MHAFAGQEAVPASWWGYDGPAGPRARTRPSVREPMRWIRGLHKHNLLKTGIILLPMWWNRGLRKHNRLKTGIILLHSGRRRRDVMPEPEWVTGYSFLTGPI